MMRELKKEHIDFLSEEFGISDIDSLDDDAFDDLYDKVVDIETNEYGGPDGTKKGELAAFIVDYMLDQCEDDESLEEAV